jgi:hypothetical protein
MEQLVVYASVAHALSNIRKQKPYTIEEKYPGIRESSSTARL